MDIGYVNLSGIHISLMGTPGLLRFKAMRNIISNGADGIVFMFDASNPESDKAAFTILNDFRNSKAMRVYLANKQDIKGARPPELLKTKFKLPKESKVIPTSAKTGSNILESFKYLVNQIFNRYSKLFKILLEYENDIKGLAEKLHKNKAEMRELLYKLEIKKFIKIDRANKVFKVTEGLKKVI